MCSTLQAANLVDGLAAVDDHIGQEDLVKVAEVNPGGAVLNQQHLNLRRRPLCRRFSGVIENLAQRSPHKVLCTTDTTRTFHGELSLSSTSVSSAASLPVDLLPIRPGRSFAGFPPTASALFSSRTFL